MIYVIMENMNDGNSPSVTEKNRYTRSGSELDQAESVRTGKNMEIQKR